MYPHTPRKFVLSLKSTVHGKVKFKGRYVIGGLREKLKNLIVHTSPTPQTQSIRFLLVLATDFDFDVWTSDTTQAYLQSTNPLPRDVFIKYAPPELELEPNRCLQLLRQLYGLSDAGDY